MSRTHSLPQALQTPLRDALGGVSKIADAIEEMVGAALPGSVRGPLSSTLGALENTGSRLRSPPVDLDEIICASAFLSGTTHDIRDAVKCAQVLAFAGETT